jgi:hypothetical protein
VSFFHNFGKLFQEKFGNPDLDNFLVSGHQLIFGEPQLFRLNRKKGAEDRWVLVVVNR